MQTSGLSIVIPTFNEADTIRPLVERIYRAFEPIGTSLEIIIIDDHSTDTTKRKAQVLKRKYPVIVREKEGRPGKGYSILEGARIASKPYIAMIDADLQYPPEVLPELFRIAQKKGIAVARRKTYHGSFIRSVASRVNAFFFGRFLLDLPTDIQSGLKVFHRDVFDHIDEKLVSAWAIDIPLLYTAYELGFTAGHVDIDFQPRTHGTSHVRFLKTSYEIAAGAVRTKFSNTIREFHTPAGQLMAGSGIWYRRKRFVTHTTLPHGLSAVVNLTLWQKLVIGLLLILFIFGMSTHIYITALIFTSVISLIYFTDVLFNLFIILQSLHNPPDITIPPKDIAELKEEKLPMYSILCPLYKEAIVLPQFIESMEALDWPKQKLDILLLLEEDDTKTIKAAKAMDLPPEYSIVIVPHSEPKTKPKACNYGLSLAKGDYIVVFDAEDRPDPLQLKKSYLAFLRAPKDVVCMQAKLNYYNPTDNLLTRLFTAEYSLWFDVILPGLQAIQTTIPLGGTSNHFRTKDLLHLRGWDPFNVTEDADLGARLFRQGYKTAMIDSTTLEEANSSVKNWFRQRSRWIKGYIQTYFVHFRNPVQFARQYGKHAILFQLIVGGKIAFMLINPLLWAVTISYFVLHKLVGPAIESVYPAPVFYMAAFSLVFGNYIYLYNYMIGVARRGQWDLVKYVLLIPMYWLMISIGAGIALIQFFLKPYYWEKTVHGLHLVRPKTIRSSFSAPVSKRLLTMQGKKLAALFEKVGAINLSGGVLIASSLIVNVVSFLFNSYLGRKVDYADFGVVSLIGSFIYITQIPVSALSSTLTHKTAFLLGKYGGAVKVFWKKVRIISVVIGLLMTGIWLLSVPFLMKFFNEHNALPFLLFAPVWFMSIVGAVDSGFLYGTMQFVTLGIIAIIEALVKLGVTVGLVTEGFIPYVYIAIPLSILVSFVLGWYQSVRTPNTKYPEEDLPLVMRFPIRFFGTSMLMKLSSIAFLVFDVLLAKHYLSPVEAGRYSLISLIGKMVFFAGTLFSQFILPLVSREIGAGRNSERLFNRLLAVITLSCLGSFTLLGPLGRWVTPLLWGSKVHSVIPLLTTYTLGIAFLCIAQAIVSYHQSRKEYLVTYAIFFLSLLQCAGFMLWHSRIEEFVNITAISGFVTLLVVILLHRFYDSAKTAASNFLDFLGLFGKLPVPDRLPGGKLRILIFNWYDVQHVWAGGAELYIHNVAKRWAENGHQVTMFTGNDTNQLRYETLDGIRIIRRGGQFTVALWAALYYIFRLQKNFDVIIDVPKGVPFFAPLFTKKPVLCLIHQVHQEMFRSELMFPLKQISMFLEAKAMPFVYRNANFIAVSESTKKAIEELGMGQGKPIVVVNPGVTMTKATVSKTSFPSVIYLGRLRPYKYVDLLIKAVSHLLKRIPDIRLTIAGTGEDEVRLKKLVQDLGIGSSVHFEGKVTERQKSRLLTQSWVAVQPSLVEGWGITNIEANVCGTPVIAADTPGLHDSVKDQYNGILVTPQNSTAIEQALEKILTSPTLRDTLSANAQIWGATFNWETCARHIEMTLTNLVQERRTKEDEETERKVVNKVRFAFANVVEIISMLI